MAGKVGKTGQDSFIGRMALAYDDGQNAALNFPSYNNLLFTLLGISLASIFAVFYGRIDALIEFFTMKWVVLLILLYGLGFGAWIYLHDLEHINKKIVRVLSLPIWFFALANFSNYFSVLRVLVFSFICISLVLISAGAPSAPPSAAEAPTTAANPRAFKECIICLENERAIMFEPCMHLVACEECSEKIKGQSDICPFCGCQFQKMSRVFLP